MSLDTSTGEISGAAPSVTADTAYSIIVTATEENADDVSNTLNLLIVDII